MSQIGLACKTLSTKNHPYLCTIKNDCTGSSLLHALTFQFIEKNGNVPLSFVYKLQDLKSSLLKLHDTKLHKNKFQNTRKDSKQSTYHVVTSHHPLPACWGPHRSSTPPLHSLHSLIIATFDCLINKTSMGGNLHGIDYLLCDSLLQTAGHYCSTWKKILLNLKTFFFKTNRVKIMAMDQDVTNKSI